MNTIGHFNSDLDLSFERLVSVNRQLIWRAWTEPEFLMKWFCPRPWKTIQCEIDLQSGGKFETTMQSPEGHKVHNQACYLAIVPFEKIIWTNALRPGYRPKSQEMEALPTTPNFQFTCVIELTEEGNQTRYRATVIHADRISCETHASMGFEAGWSKAFEQMIEAIECLN